LDYKTVIFQVAGGLGLFLMGMKVMSEGMQKAAGDRLRRILRILTVNRFVGVFVGFVITAIIQSSSATSVMTIGFVNATLMTVAQAVSVELGAAVGTTVTGWIVTLDIAAASMPVIAVGVLITFFSKNRTWQYFGEVLFGFGILFLGMEAMKHGFAPLKTHEGFLDLFRSIDGHTFASVLLGVLVGTFTTAVVQSSSAVVGIVIALASQGLVNFEGALAIVMGSNIGTTVTGLLASIGGSVNARRAAVAQTLFKALGVVLILTVFYPFRSLVDVVTPDSPMDNLTVHVAMGHTIFNLLNLAVFLPLIGPLVRLVNRLVPDRVLEEEGLPEHFVNIDYSLIHTPSMALLESQKELVVMGEYVARNLELVRQTFGATPEDIHRICDEVVKNEERIDRYQYAITQFLLTLSTQSLTMLDASTVGNYVGLAHNLEKISDFAERITQSLDKMARLRLTLSEPAVESLRVLLDENVAYFSESMALFREGELHPAYAEKAFTRRLRLKKMVKDAKAEHFDRLRDKACEMPVAIHYIDILSNLDSMKSENYNIAEVVSGKKY
jgi:phosphate:Na+ symporter